MLKKNLVSFEPTTFSQKLTLYLPETNSHSNRFFFESDTTKRHPATIVKRENPDYKYIGFFDLIRYELYGDYITET